GWDLTRFEQAMVLGGREPVRDLSIDAEPRDDAGAIECCERAERFDPKTHQEVTQSRVVEEAYRERCEEVCRCAGFDDLSARCGEGCGERPVSDADAGAIVFVQSVSPKRMYRFVDSFGHLLLDRFFAPEVPGRSARSHHTQSGTNHLHPGAERLDRSD